MQQILKGYENIENALSEVGSKRYMLVCDTSFPFLPIKDYFHPAALFNGFTPNPLYEQVCAGVRLFNENQCDAIVAVGGGGARTVGDIECFDHAGHVVEVVASGIHPRLHDRRL